MSQVAALPSWSFLSMIFILFLRPKGLSGTSGRLFLDKVSPFFVLPERWTVPPVLESRPIVSRALFSSFMPSSWSSLFPSRRVNLMNLILSSPILAQASERLNAFAKVKWGPEGQGGMVDVVVIHSLFFFVFLSSTF